MGKTYDMLGEGQRRAGRGTDVVIAFMEDYGRPLTRQMAQGLKRYAAREVFHLVKQLQPDPRS